MGSEAERSSLPGRLNLMLVICFGKTPRAIEVTNTAMRDCTPEDVGFLFGSLMI